MNLVYELRVCDGCRHGDLQKRLGEARGWAFHVDVTHLGDTEHICVEVEAAPGFTIPFEAAFTREGFLQKAKKIFKREPQVGDDAFDAAVYIESDDESTTLSFLEQSGVKSALWELLAETGELQGSYVTIGEEMVRARTTSANPGVRREAPLYIAVLVHRLELFATERAATRGPYR